MKTYLQMDGGQLVEYVEKREYDGLRAELTETQRQMRGLLNQLHSATAERDESHTQLQAAVKRMEAVNWESWADVPSTHAALEGLHSELIQAAKGEQP